MNSVLDSSPLEALAFDYVSFGLINVVNSLWTWLAVVTAAVSFWGLSVLRTRSLEGFKHHAPPSSNDVVKSSNGCSRFPQTPPCTVSSPSPSSSRVALPSSSVRFQDDIDGGVTKGGKFTLYFYEVHVNGYVDDDGDDVAETAEETSGGENWWEGGLRMRTEEKSWYRCQDLRVFNGNVVRLWDNRCFD